MMRSAASTFAAAVAVAAEYARGHVTVLDRPGLEAASCGCYRAVRREFERLRSDAAEQNPISRCC